MDQHVMTRWKVLWDTPDYHEDGCKCPTCHEEYGILDCDCEHCVELFKEEAI